MNEETAADLAAEWLEECHRNPPAGYLPAQDIPNRDQLMRVARPLLPLNAQWAILPAAPLYPVIGAAASESLYLLVPSFEPAANTTAGELAVTCTRSRLDRATVVSVREVRQHLDVTVTRRDWTIVVPGGDPLRFATATPVGGAGLHQVDRLERFARAAAREAGWPIDDA